MLLVQAVSQHRQRRPGDAAVSMLNLISAYRAQPEASAEGGAVGAVQWGEREELKELYGIFCAKVRCISGFYLGLQLHSGLRMGRACCAVALLLPVHPGEC